MSARDPRDERGVAMILVIVWTTVVLLLVLITTQAILFTIRPSDLNETSFQALAAAEAGIDDYRTRLQLLGTPSAVAGQADAALGGKWRPIPGSTTGPTFTYEVIDDTLAAQAGTVRLRSFGNYRGQTRVLEVLLRKRTTYDYAYVSANETIAPNTPTGYPNNSLSYADAERLCGNVWYVPAYKANDSPLQLGTHRNSRVCRFIGIQPGDVYDGDVHSNDVWYFNDGNLTGVFGGRVTTSCPPGDGSNGCPAEQRWIAGSQVATSAGNKNSDYYPTEIPIPGNSLQPNVAWNPQYDTPLDLPATPAALRQKAIDKGCYFRGPTRIRWLEGGSLLVTSPDTRNASINSFCVQPGKSYRATSSNPSSQTTMLLDYATMVAAGFNGVLYVDSVASDDTQPPSCQVKTTGTRYPYVIPDAATFNEESPRTFPAWQAPLSSGAPFGFPIPTTKDPQNQSNNTADPWAAGYCGEGIAYVQGAYSGAYTLAAAWDIVVTGHLVDQQLKSANWQTPATVSTYGIPPAGSTNSLGLIPGRFLYVYLPNSNWATGWNHLNVKDLVINAAVTILNGCFTVQDQSINAALGNLFVIGSLAQKYHCRVERENYNGQGYQDFYLRYDRRYARTVAPPSMADLFTEPWKVVQVSEILPDAVTPASPPPAS